MHASKYDDQVSKSFVERATTVIKSGPPSDFTLRYKFLLLTKELWPLGICT